MKLLRLRAAPLFICAALALAGSVSRGQALTSFAQQNWLSSLQNSCSDDRSVEVLRAWLEALPRESRDAIPDEAVRRVVNRLEASPTAEDLRGAAQRIFLHHAATTGSIDLNKLERQLAELRRDYPGVVFPADVRQALVSREASARSYLGAALAAAHIAPKQDCSKIFQSYLSHVDDRVGLLSTYSARFGIGNVLQQTVSGTEDDRVYTLPVNQCVLRPSPPEFYKVNADGHFAGQYSALGFSDAVKLFLSNSDDSEQWTCSGVLLSSTWVLTAAHCIELGARIAAREKTRAVVNGSVGAARALASLPTYSAIKSDAKLADGYLTAMAAGADTTTTDLALLELVTPLQVSTAPQSDAPNIPVSAIGTLAGYGATEAAPSASRPTPAVDVGWLNVSISQNRVSWSSTAIQTGPGVNASCPGDSGAPIYVVMDKQSPGVTRPGIGCTAESRQLIGLVSYGQSLNEQSCLSESIGGGPRLLAHLQWICQTTGAYCK